MSKMAMFSGVPGEEDYRARTMLWGAFTSREWEDYCNGLVRPVLEFISNQGPYVFCDEPMAEAATLPEYYLTPKRIQNMLSRETNISGWKVSFDSATHKIVIAPPNKPEF